MRRKKKELSRLEAIESDWATSLAIGGGLVKGGQLLGRAYDALDHLFGDGNTPGDNTPQAATPDDVSASTPVGQKGSEMSVPDGTNSPANIGGRDYSGHSLDKMQERGLTPSTVEDAIQNGVSKPGNMPGTTEHIGQGVTAITNNAGRVVTAHPNSY